MKLEKLLVNPYLMNSVSWNTAAGLGTGIGANCGTNPDEFCFKKGSMRELTGVPWLGDAKISRGFCSTKLAKAALKEPCVGDGSTT